MSRAAVLAGVVSVVADLRLSQAEALAALVASALRVGRDSLAAPPPIRRVRSTRGSGRVSGGVGAAACRSK
jgi:hypothetical protein